MSEKETRFTIEYGCSRGYWIKCFETEEECFEEMYSPNQNIYQWYLKENYDKLEKENQALKQRLDKAVQTLKCIADNRDNAGQWLCDGAYETLQELEEENK